MALNDCRITNAVQCLAPKNKPTAAEIRTCNGYLKVELARLSPGAVVVALGTIAHRAVLRAFDLRPSRFPFAHGERHRLRIVAGSSIPTIAADTI